MIDPQLSLRLDEINRKLDHHHELLHNLIERQADEKSLILDLQERTIAMSVITDRLAASVAAETTVEQSAVVLLGQLSQLIRDNATDPVALAKIADDIDGNAKTLADAVTANTPTPPVTPPANPPA
jgi:DNA uptake protein ComE-like DNA-binding protein